MAKSLRHFLCQKFQAQSKRLPAWKRDSVELICPSPVSRETLHSAILQYYGSRGYILVDQYVRWDEYVNCEEQKAIYIVDYPLQNEIHVHWTIRDYPERTDVSEESRKELTRLLEDKAQYTAADVFAIHQSVKSLGFVCEREFDRSLMDQLLSRMQQTWTLLCHFERPDPPTIACITFVKPEWPLGERSTKEFEKLKQWLRRRPEFAIEAAGQQ